jgi:small subunit ribosomal protein S16
MLTIRLQRVGTKNKPQVRLVLAEAHKSASKKFIEVLGHYHPRSKQFGIKSEERLKYWLGQHIQLSPTVHNLFVEKKLISEAKVKAWSPKKKEGETPAEGQAPAAPQAAVTPAAEAAPAPEAPKTETPAA